MHEHYLVVRDRADRSVVTVIELLSPTNKSAGSRGRESFLQKRREAYASPAHWMEIDLLRDGPRTAHHTPAVDADYRVFLSRADKHRRSAYVRPIELRQRLPTIGVPLRGEVLNAPLDLQAVFDLGYQRGSYDLDLDDATDPLPPMSDEALAWARATARAVPTEA